MHWHIDPNKNKNTDKKEWGLYLRNSVYNLSYFLQIPDFKNYFQGLVASPWNGIKS